MNIILSLKLNSDNRGSDNRGSTVLVHVFVFILKLGTHECIQVLSFSNVPPHV